MKTLTDPLPLRSTAEWAGFREAVSLPVRVGLTRGKLIQYSQDRTKWVWSGHASQSIAAVFVGGLPVTNWNAANVLDSASKPVMMVTFDAPLDEGAEATAQGRGLMDATTGDLIENPADALLAILRDLAGLEVDAERLSAFRAESAAAQIFVGGSIESPDSAQTVARALCSSVGALFGSAARGLAFLWPGGGDQPARYLIGNSSGANTVELTRAFNVADFCNDLTIQYDFDGDSPRQSIRLTAPAQVARYGATAQTLAAKWLTSQRVAQLVGGRLLAQTARKVWLVTAAGLDAPDLRLGDRVQFGHALFTDAGRYPILSRETDFVGSTQITARVPIGAAPAIAIASQSTYFDVNPYVSLIVQTQGTDHVFTIYDSDGVTPLGGATVQILPNGTSKPTDAQGKVSFTALQMPAGHHYDLGVTAQDGRYYTFGLDI